MSDSFSENDLKKLRAAGPNLCERVSNCRQQQELPRQQITDNCGIEGEITDYIESREPDTTIWTRAVPPTGGKPTLASRLFICMGATKPLSAMLFGRKLGRQPETAVHHEWKESDSAVTLAAHFFKHALRGRKTYGIAKRILPFENSQTPGKQPRISSGRKPQWRRNMTLFAFCCGANP